jgi:biotin carboxyl carrier protein
MILEVESGGTVRHVDVRGGDVLLDAQPVRVDAAAVPGGWSLITGGRSFDVLLAEAPGGELTVQVNGRLVIVRVADNRFGTRRGRAAEADADNGPYRVTSPMPGRVTKLLVKPGDAVTARQGVAVIEAMKMENELRSPRAGRVTEVRAIEGALVDANAVLVVIE